MKKKIIKTDFSKNSHGLARRENLANEEMYKGTPFPQTVSYKDIDREVKEWVKNDLKLEFEGVETPTFMLMSNQRFSEYSQTWSYDDGNGGILFNFKTLRRETNPQQGSGQDNYFNIPGEHMWAMFYDKVLEDNGSEGYNVYKIKQPLSIDLTYYVSIVTNKIDLINLMNTKVQNLFKSLQCYIRVNGHFMPLILDSIDDKSEYNFENRKFYVQTFQIKCLAYIIQESDFEVERLPHRTIVAFENDGVDRPTATINSVDESDVSNEYIEVNVTFMGNAKNKISFRVDEDIFVHGCDTFNVNELSIVRYGDDYVLDPNKGFTLRKHEKLTISIKRKSLGEDAVVKLNGKNPYFNYYDDLEFIQNKDEEINNVIYTNKKEEYLDKGRHTQEIVESTTRMPK